ASRSRITDAASRITPATLPREAQLAAHRLVAQPEPLLDRALDEPRDLAVRSLEQQAIRAAVPAREHAEPRQEPPRRRLSLDDEQLIDRFDREAAAVIAH